ncbi:MAG TPA: hypothetical protein PLS29_05420 [Acidimicrobiales bacterium]|nr:MAG: hypothetical protein B7Z69_08030 [Actinobacteria bacterium 21-73-9]HQU26453.1 hypothetical protein [Acidimicrobiales bacterium]
MSAKTKNVLLIYSGLALAEALCWTAFGVELDRALTGNRLSWAYVFEWPLFSLYAVYMARKMLREERSVPAPAPVDPAEDAAREAYNEYLRLVHHDDGPPTG